MSARTVREVSYQVDVIGTIWQGTDAAMRYTFRSLPTKAEVIAKAGDFDHIQNYQTTQIVRGGSWRFDWTKRKIVQSWTVDESADVFADSMSGWA